MSKVINLTSPFLVVVEMENLSFNIQKSYNYIKIRKQRMNRESQTWAVTTVSSRFVYHYQGTILLLLEGLKHNTSALFHHHGTAVAHEKWFQSSIYDASSASQARVSLLM